MAIAVPVAHVDWIDAGIVATRWEDREEVLGERQATCKGLIRSSGFLISSDPEGVVLALSINDNNDDVNLAMFIPQSSIRRMQVWQPQEVS